MQALQHWRACTAETLRLHKPVIPLHPYMIMCLRRTLIQRVSQAGCLAATGNRIKIAVDGPRLRDRMAGNLAKHEITESESLLIGRNFGPVTDIETGPNRNVLVASLTDGAIYEIFRQPPPGRN